MINQILNILNKYDEKTNGNLALDFKQEVLTDKNYTEAEFIEVLTNEWIPIWLNEREYDKEAIEQLLFNIKKL